MKLFILLLLFCGGALHASDENALFETYFSSTTVEELGEVERAPNCHANFCTVRFSSNDHLESYSVVGSCGGGGFGLGTGCGCSVPVQPDGYFPAMVNTRLCN